MNFLKTLQAQGLIDDTAYQNLQVFVSLILEWNSKINLTGFKIREEIEEILIGEAVFALKAVPVAGRSILDFGSGAGIPGLVWTLCNPTSKVTSVESRQKKVAFQKEVLRETQRVAEVIWGRFPEAVGGRHFDVVVTRAIRFSPALWLDAQKLLNPGGIMVRFGSHSD